MNDRKSFVDNWVQVTPVMCLGGDVWNTCPGGGTIERVDGKIGLRLVFKWKGADRRRFPRVEQPGICDEPSSRCI